MPEANRLVRSFVVDQNGAGLRVDRFMASVPELPSRSQLRMLDAVVTINDEPARLSRRVGLGDRVTVSFLQGQEEDIRPEKIDLDVLFENDDVIVLNKHQGMVVHPAAGNWSGTVAQGLLYRVADLGTGTYRPGIVHRLDKDTSGVMITAKNAVAQEFLASQFRNRTVVKSYLAVVKGAPPASRGTIETRIARDPANRKRFTSTQSGGRKAVTEYLVKRRFSGYSLMILHPLTGRTHQIRVHMKHLGCPIVGDPIYSRRDSSFPEATLLLHAESLRITLPGGSEETTFSAPLPEHVTAVLKVLEHRLSEG